MPEFTNISQAIKAIRDRELECLRCGGGLCKDFALPTLAEDRNLTLAIMALGVKLHLDSLTK